MLKLLFKDECGKSWAYFQVQNRNVFVIAVSLVFNMLYYYFFVLHLIADHLTVLAAKKNPFKLGHAVFSLFTAEV